MKSSITLKIISTPYTSEIYSGNARIVQYLYTLVLKSVTYSNLICNYLMVFPVVLARADLMGRHPGHSHWYSCLKESTLGLMLCCGHLKILNFLTRYPIFDIGRSGIGSWLCHPLSTCPWASHLAWLYHDIVECYGRDGSWYRVMLSA